MSRRLYSVTEMMDLFKVKRTTVWQWSSNRKFTTYKVGRLMFDAEEVDEYIKGVQRPGSEALAAMASELMVKMKKAA